MRKNGVRFLETPKSYYDNLEERVGKIDEDIEKLKELNILVDRDYRGLSFTNIYQANWRQTNFLL
jgi:4-hydroxyphenylpyruvate dioxygenase (EC 1.13.11.27)